MPAASASSACASAAASNPEPLVADCNNKNKTESIHINEIANLHLQTMNLSWDYTIDPNHTIDHISLDKVNSFIDASNKLREHPINDDPLTVLHKYELLRDEKITIGCFLLFCQAPSIITTIDAGRFDSETIIRDNRTIRTDLFAEIDACMDFISKHTSKRFVITGKPQRNEVWEYPLEALREIVINMIVHRDYRASGDSTIKVFDDRIEFFNPGGLPSNLTLEDILSGKNPSVPRNKQIASIFKETGAIEKYGSGIKRVLQTMSEAGASKPIFETFSGYFKVTLYPINKNKGQANGGVNGGVNGGANGGVNAVLQIIEQNPGIKSTVIKDKLHLSQRTIERRLGELKKKNLVKFVGPPKSGGYYPASHSK